MKILILLGIVMLYGTVIILGLAMVAFWIWMLVDCAKRVSAGEKDLVGWLVVVALLHFLGALIYFIFGRTKGPPALPVGSYPAA